MPTPPDPRLLLWLESGNLPVRTTLTGSDVRGPCGLPSGSKAAEGSAGSDERGCNGTNRAGKFGAFKHVLPNMRVPGPE